MKKIFFLASLLMVSMSIEAQVYLDENASLEQRVEDALSRMTTREKIKVLHAQSKFTSAGVPRLGIRQLNMDDGPHGVREELEWNSWRPAGWTNDFCEAFPSLTCLAATWNRDLSRLYGHSVSEEFAYRGKDLMLGPGVNIQRTPLNGRAFEYMGEDPWLAAEMVVPYIEAVQKNGVGCCLKHFALNDQETDRFGVNVNVSERAMREIYLYPFEQAVKRAKVWSIMGSYNLLDNVHCCHNDFLLNGILKKEWQWDGAVVSDWGGTTNTMEAVHGGLDIEMGTFTDGKLRESEFTYDDYYLARPFLKLVEEGKVHATVLDEKVRRVLRLIFRTAMTPEKVVGSLCSDAHVEACRQIASEGIVLLKNSPFVAPKTKKKDAQPLLPLEFSQYERILVVGENATRLLMQGGGSSELKTDHEVTPLQALKKLFGSRIDYAQGYASGQSIYDRVDEVASEKNEQLKREALAKAREADLIIFIGGLNKNHRQDCENGDREGYDLSFGQNELIGSLAQIQPRIVVVTYGGNPYATPWLDRVPALLHCWYLGSENGYALADVLTGKVNPSGRLPVTFAAKYEDYPYVKYGKEAYPGVPNSSAGINRRGSQVYYKEDVFVGYRGFNRDKTVPLFPFGYGLSYTTFKYGKPVVSGNTVSVEVTNTGSRTGKETVQLYIGFEKAQEDRPLKELKDFTKIELQPGERKTVSFSITDDKLRFFSIVKNQWTVEPGKYRLYVGGSSAEDKNAVSYTRM